MVEKKTVILTRFVDSTAAVNVTAKVCDKWDELALRLYVESARHQQKDGYLDSEIDFHWKVLMKEAVDEDRAIF